MQPDSVALDNAFVWVKQERVECQGYADMVELGECLDALHQGTLDEVPDLTRLWMPLEQLIPGKRLMSQLDSSTLRRCLYQISELARTAIAFHWEPEDSELLQTMAHHFVHSQTSENFSQFCANAHTDALVELALLVYKVL